MGISKRYRRKRSTKCVKVKHNKKTCKKTNRKKTNRKKTNRKKQNGGMLRTCMGRKCDDPPPAYDEADELRRTASKLRKSTKQSVAGSIKEKMAGPNEELRGAASRRRATVAAAEAEQEAERLEQQRSPLETAVQTNEEAIEMERQQKLQDIMSIHRLSWPAVFGSDNGWELPLKWGKLDVGYVDGYFRYNEEKHRHRNDKVLSAKKKLDDIKQKLSDYKEIYGKSGADEKQIKSVEKKIKDIDKKYGKVLDIVSKLRASALPRKQSTRSALPRDRFGNERGSLAGYSDFWD